MHKDKALSYIKQNLSSEEKFVGFFYAQKPAKIWLFFIIGPLYIFSIKHYFVAITNKGVHFYEINLFGKFSQHDFFTYDEIDKVKMGKGIMQIPMEYFFANGRKLKIKAQKKGMAYVAKIEEKTLEYIAQNSKSA